MKGIARFFGMLIVLVSISTMTIKEAATKNEVPSQPASRETAAAGLPPPTWFEPYVTPWSGRFEMSEEQSIIVGELVVECYPNAPPPVFAVLQPSPAFVRIVPLPCTCPDQARAKVIVFPRRGDAGRYNIVLLARTCSGLGDIHGFILRVRKAAQQ